MSTSAWSILGKPLGLANGHKDFGAKEKRKEMELSAKEIKNLISFLIDKHHDLAEKFKEEGDEDNSLYFLTGGETLQDLLTMINKPENFKWWIEEANREI